MQSHQIRTDDAGQAGFDLGLPELEFRIANAQVAAQSDLKSCAGGHAIPRCDARFVEVAHGLVHRMLTREPCIDVVDRIAGGLIQILPRTKGAIACAMDYDGAYCCIVVEVG